MPGGFATRLGINHPSLVLCLGDDGLPSDPISIVLFPNQLAVMYTTHGGR